jgi:hypothetical protein
MLLMIGLLLHQETGCYALDSFPNEKTFRQKTVAKNTGALRARLKGDFKKIAGDRYLLKKSGQGDYGTFRDVNWEITSEAELREGLLCPLRTVWVIRDKGNRAVLAGKNEYDDRRKSVHIVIRDAAGEVTKQLIVTQEPAVTDFATSAYFLIPFIDDLQTGKTIRYHMISSEPAMYKLKAEFAGEDTVMAAAQELQAIKVRITPDMGLMGTMLDKFLPETYLWYSKTVPHVLLKYEGLESGKGSAHIITTAE